MFIRITVDGSCVQNHLPGKGAGGWAAILQLVEGDNEVTMECELKGSHPATTNNEMEARAALAGLLALKGSQRVVIRTDSQNLIGWCAKNWKCTANPELAKLVSRIKAASKGHAVTWEHVKGHAGDPLNERCDSLAKDQARKELSNV